MRSSLITLLFFLLGGVVGACASVSVDTIVRRSMCSIC